MPLTKATLEALTLGRQLLLATKDPAEAASIKADLDVIQWNAAKEDPWYFLTVLAKTKNELGEDDDKYEPFPDKQYIRELLRCWQTVDNRPFNKHLLIAKSRQVMASWFVCAMFLYYCMTQEAVRAGWQGKKAEDTDEMLKRIYGIWQRLPEFVKQEHPCEPKFLHLHFPRTQGDIHAIPQGPHQVRQFTWRLFMGDEFAFQEEAEAAYYALLPALGDKGMLVSCSSAAPGHFEMMYEDRLALGVAK